MSTKYCVLCRSRTTEKFVSVPRDENRRELWSRITGLKFSSSTKICDKHFKDSDFYYKLSTKATRRRQLMISAVPQKPEPKKWFTKHMPSTCRDNVFDSQTEEESCGSSSSHLIRVPRDGPKKQKCINATQIKLEATDRVCENHFNESDSYILPDTVSKPKVMLPNDVSQRKTYSYPGEMSSSARHMCDFSSQTEQETIECGVSLENMRLKLKIMELQQENDRLVKELQTRESLTDSLKEIFTEQQIRKLENGNTRVYWSPEDISSGISLHTAGPNAYKLLLKRGFPFPSLSTLQKSSKLETK